MLKLKKFILTAGKWFLLYQLFSFIIAVIFVGYFVIWDQETLIRFIMELGQTVRIQVG